MSENVMMQPAGPVGKRPYGGFEVFTTFDSPISCMTMFDGGLIVVTDDGNCWIVDAEGNKVLIEVADDP